MADMNAARGSSVEIDGRTYTVSVWVDEDGFDHVTLRIEPPISWQYDPVAWEYIGKFDRASTGEETKP